MTRSVVRVLVAVCLLGALLIARTPGSTTAQQSPAPSTPPPAATLPASDTPAGQQVFRAGADAVLVDVYPHRDGRIVEGLTIDQFEVFEDGEPQRIDSFEFVRLEGGAGDGTRRDPGSLREMRAEAADPHNRVFVVYLDKGHTTVEGGNLIRQPLLDMLNRAVGPQDLFGVMLPGMRPVDITLGRRSLSIEDQLAQYWTWGQRQRVSDDPTDPMEAQLTQCFEMRHVPAPPPNQHAASGIEPWVIDDELARRTLDLILIDRRREDRALESLEHLVTYLGQLREARSVVVTVTDGWLLFSRAPHLEAQPPRDARFYRALARPGDRLGSTPLSPRQDDPRASALGKEFAACVQELNRLVSIDSERRLRDLIELANRSNVSFYPVASAGLQAFDTPISDRTEPAAGVRPVDLSMRDMARVHDRVNALLTIAESTDGIAVVNTNDFTGGMRRIVEDVSAYYLLTYVSTNSQLDGRFRRIEVRVQTPDLSLRARRGYTATRADLAAADPPGPPPLAAGLAEALGALERLRASAPAFAHGAIAGATLHVAVELPGGPGATRWPAGTEVTAAVATETGAAVGATTAPLDRDWRNAALALPAPDGDGPWSVTVTIGSGLDRVSEQVIVSRSDGTLLGEARIFRARPAPRAPLRPVATRQFTRLERVHVEWPILAALERREARLLDARGQPLGAPVVVSEIAEPVAAVAADLPLGPLAPGDYVIELTAAAAGHSVLRYVAFRITQ